MGTRRRPGATASLALMLWLALPVGRASAQSPPDAPPEPPPEPAPTAPVAPSPAPPPPPAAARTTLSVATEILALGSAGVSFVGLYALFDALAKGGKLDSVCVSNASGPSQCPQSASGAINDYNIELAVGGIALTLGLTMGVVAYFLPSDPAPQSAFTIHLGPGGVQGTF